MIKVENLCKSYKIPGGNVKVINNLSINIEAGQKVAIVGPSGTGKSTLLNILSGMEMYDSGYVIVNDINYKDCNKKQLDKIRFDNYGFIFQSFYLVETLNVYDNIILPMLAKSGNIDREYVNEICERLEIGHRINFYPQQLSGGEQQRVAIARALINKPKVVFADEPTGNLDFINSKNVIKLLCECCNNYNQTLVIVTHDRSITEYADRIIELQQEKL